MDFRERILTAMEHREPDRVPVMGLIMDPATVDRILGRQPADLVGLLQNPDLAEGIVSSLNTNKAWNSFYYSNTAGALECAIELGFDANWTIYTLMQLHEDPESALGYAWYDVFGRVWDISRTEGGGTAINYSRPLCPTEEQWEAWIEEHAELFDTMVEDTAAFHKKLVEEYGDRIMPIGYAAPGIFENSWQPIGFVNFTRFVYEKPEFVRRVIDFHTGLYLRSVEAVMLSGVEVVIGGDDLGHKTGPMMRPRLIEELLGESYRRVSALVHEAGRKLIWHSCGNIYQLLEMFIGWGFDGIVTMEPTAGMELGKVRQMVGHQLVLVGNLDVSHLLVRGSREEVEDAVKQAIRDAAEGGGYILSSCHSHPDVDGERLGWMVEATHTYGKYPIRI